MKVLISLILIIVNINVFSDNISEYQFIKIKKIAVGNEKGMIGWEKPEAGGPSGPITWIINKENIIYIPDRYNKRINIYDLNLNIIDTIIEKGTKRATAHNAYSLKCDKNGNLIYLTSSTGLKKIDQKGNLIFSLNSSELSNQIKGYNNYFPIDSLIFTYDDNKKINVISEDGKIYGPEKAKEELKKIELSKNNDTLNSINNPNMLDDNIQDFIVFSNRLYNSYFYSVKEYYKTYFPQVKIRLFLYFSFYFFGFYELRYI